MPDKFTGFAADAFLMQQLQQAEEEIAMKHNPNVTVYSYPLLENLFQNVITFALTLDEENQWRKTLFLKTETYRKNPAFVTSYIQAKDVFYAIYEFLNGIGLFSHREKPQDKIEWSWDEVRQTDRRVG
jgi:hypothetical protein